MTGVGATKNIIIRKQRSDIMRRIILLFILASLLAACSLVQQPQTKPLPNSPTPTQTQTAMPQTVLQQKINRFDGKAGLFAKKLSTGDTIEINADTIFPTASTHKLVIALAVYKYLYQDADTTTKERYDKDIKQMMVVSDNAAFYRLLAEIENKQPDALNRVLSDLKLTHTRIHSREAFRQHGYHSVTTPREMATVMETIYREEYLGPQMSAILKEELANTIFHQEIPRFMQSKVLHKAGELPGMMCDVGIVDDGRDQILLSVFTLSARSPQYASDFIANTSADAYNALRTK